MKHLIILLAICALSSVTFGESAKSNDVLQTIPGAREHKTLIADTTDTPAAIVSTKTVVQTTTTKKTVTHVYKKKHKKHHYSHQS